MDRQADGFIVFEINKPVDHKTSSKKQLLQLSQSQAPKVAIHLNVDQKGAKNLF